MVSGLNKSQSQPHGHSGGIAAFARRDATIQKVEPAKLAEGLPEPLCPLKTLERKMLPKPSSSTGAQEAEEHHGVFPLSPSPAVYCDSSQRPIILGGVHRVSVRPSPHTHSCQSCSPDR